MWSLPSGYHLPALSIDLDTDTIQFIQAINRWGSIRVSMAGYILEGNKTNKTNNSDTCVARSIQTNLSVIC